MISNLSMDYNESLQFWHNTKSSVLQRLNFQTFKEMCAGIRLTKNFPFPDEMQPCGDKMDLQAWLPYCKSWNSEDD